MHLWLMTPLERELLVRLTALMEASQGEIERLDDKIEWLQQYVPDEVEEARQKAARAALYTLVETLETKPKAHVRVASE